MHRFILFFIVLGLLFTGPGPVPAGQKTADTAGLVFDPKNDAGFYYTIQKGDTLWDLSEKFYQSQWDWPGLWELNKELKNPHWIYPGNKIKIFLKKDRPPPPAQPDSPAPEPPRIVPSFSYPEMNRIGFIRREAQPSLGRILKEKDGHLMMSINDILYIKPSGRGVLTPGEIYQVFTCRTWISNSTRPGSGASST